jgi:hypothetical protein
MVRVISFQFVLYRHANGGSDDDMAGSRYGELKRTITNKQQGLSKAR